MIDRSALSAALKSPTLLPQAYELGADAMRLVRMSPEHYAQASFLDDRLLKLKLPSEIVSVADLAGAIADYPAGGDCGFIFHLGHVGSTLVSRLLGAHPGVLSLREPASLRVLADLSLDTGGRESLLDQAGWEQRLALLVRLLARTYGPQQLAVVKATSIVSEIAPQLMAGEGVVRRALALTSPPETYLPIILGGVSARQDLRVYGVNRIRRLHRRVGATCWRLSEMSLGELAAMTWASEMTALVDGSRGQGRKWLWLDFDVFLDKPQSVLGQIFHHFGRAVAPAEVEAIVSGPLMKNYSKHPGADFDAATRRRRIEAAKADRAEDIAVARAWLDRAAKEHPVVAEALAHCARVAAARPPSGPSTKTA